MKASVKIGLSNSLLYSFISFYADYLSFKGSILFNFWLIIYCYRPDRYVPLFGEYAYDSSKWRLSVPFVEQLKAFQELISEGKVDSFKATTSYVVSKLTYKSHKKCMFGIASMAWPKVKSMLFVCLTKCG